MRGSWHDTGIREYTISANGPEIKDSFRNYEGIISGSPSRVSVDEKSELSRIVRGVQLGIPKPPSGASDDSE
jgi:circadian clock protein KaiC